jgi:hypothetical protein
MIQVDEVQAFCSGQPAMVELEPGYGYSHINDEIFVYGSNRRKPFRICLSEPDKHWRKNLLRYFGVKPNRISLPPFFAVAEAAYDWMNQ